MITYIWCIFMRQAHVLDYGETVTGEYIEKRYKKYKVWIPSKDMEGIDFLVTNPINKNQVSIQVKFSKDYAFPNKNNGKDGIGTNINIYSWLWRSFSKSSLEKSNADIWIFVLHHIDENEVSDDFLIIPKEELIKRFNNINTNTVGFDLVVFQNDKNKMEVLNLSGIKGQLNNVLLNNYQNIKDRENRDYTEYFNVWKVFEDKLE